MALQEESTAMKYGHPEICILVEVTTSKVIQLTIMIQDVHLNLKIEKKPQNRKMMTTRKLSTVITIQNVRATYKSERIFLDHNMFQGRKISAKNQRMKKLDFIIQNRNMIHSKLNVFHVTIIAIRVINHK